MHHRAILQTLGITLKDLVTVLIEVWAASSQSRAITLVIRDNRVIKEMMLNDRVSPQCTHDV